MNEDLILGKKFGRLTVIGISDTKVGNRPTLICSCECGNDNFLVQRKKLLSGHTKSCGCLQQETRKSNSLLTGKVFDRLTVIRPTEERDKKGLIKWECKCDCGNKINISTTELTTGNTKSCGCLHLENGYLSANDKNVFEHYDKTCVSIIKNKKPNKNNKLKVKGVHKDKKRNKFVANIMFNGVRYYLGRYDEIEDAIEARKLAESNLHDEFIRWYELNKATIK